jgi:hypothetical protein
MIAKAAKKAAKKAARKADRQAAAQRNNRAAAKGKQRAAHSNGAPKATTASKRRPAPKPIDTDAEAPLVTRADSLPAKSAKMRTPLSARSRQNLQNLALFALLGALAAVGYFWFRT